MEVIRGSENIPAGLRGAVVTIGNFDGVHLGHQYIFRHLIAEAHKERRPAVVISFDPHPKMVLHPERRPFYLITSLEEKIRHLSNLGIDALHPDPLFPRLRPDHSGGVRLWFPLGKAPDPENPHRPGLYLRPGEGGERGVFDRRGRSSGI